MSRYMYPEQARMALEALQQPLAVYESVDGQIATILVSDGFCRMLGFKDREQAMTDLEHEIYVNAHPDDRERIAKAGRRFAGSGEESEYEVIFRTKAGADSGYHVIHAHGVHVYPEPGVRLAHVWYMDEGPYIEGEETTANGRMGRAINSMLHEESILRATNYDVLTGLPNLAFFFKQCEIWKVKLLREGQQVCLLYLDLNGMKYYNHRNGFAEGDRLLKSFADLLSRTFGLEECCHIGADRFAVAAIEEGLADRVRRFFDEVSLMENHLPVRVGIYSTSLGDAPVGTAYDRAKIACDSIPRTEKSRYKYFTRELLDASRNRRFIQTGIDRAIAEKHIQAYYQPIVRAVNGRVCDEEALARWIDPERGFMSPAEFIPYLEESGDIYKLDLYILEQVLEKMRRQKEIGLHIVPHSINLSRSDFIACDIVEEIRKRVDKAGVSRRLITIEVTESVIGSNLEFMKKEIAKFRALGFPVWMDDFGSGYSSLEMLQSIQFDLIKFDMSFLRRLNEGDGARIVLTEMMRMAVSLGVDTICEGVETEEQVIFLREIGCSKLQGFYYCKPIPIEEILDRYRTGRQIGFEDPEESGYYETIGRINLYDLDVIACRDESVLHHSFSTIPIGIIEMKDGKVRLVRSNPSYRKYLKRFFGIQIRPTRREYRPFFTPVLELMVKNNTEQGNPVIYDETMSDGTVVHTIARRISTNPKTGDIALAVAVLSVSMPEEDLSIERIRS